MGWSDDAAMTQEAALDPSAFGEPVTFVPEGDVARQVFGIFRAMHREVDPQTLVVIESEQPEVHVRSIDLPRPPRPRKDRFIIRGVDYLVVDPRHDGEGMYRVGLHVASKPL